MNEPIVDEERLKAFIRDRTKATWSERSLPYFISFVATDLKSAGIDYRSVLGTKKLRDWVVSSDFPDTKVLVHPRITAKVGFVPSDVDYEFVDDDSQGQIDRPGPVQALRSSALHRFVESLSRLPEESISDFSIPAKTLIALLKKK